jgi:hypothetical protein
MGSGVTLNRSCKFVRVNYNRKHCTAPEMATKSAADFRSAAEPQPNKDERSESGDPMIG